MHETQNTYQMQTGCRRQHLQQEKKFKYLGIQISEYGIIDAELETKQGEQPKQRNV